MKRHLWGILPLLAAILLLTGCMEEDADGSRSGVPVVLTASVIETGHVYMTTRAGTDVQSTQLANGEDIFVSLSGDVTKSSATYVADGNGNTSSPSPAYFTPAGTSAIVRAYHGKSGGTGGTQVTNTSASFSVAANQSSDEAYQASDLMYATATASKGTPGALTFSHKMAKIIVNAMTGSGITGISAVKFVGGYRTVNITDATECILGTTLTDALSNGSALTVFSGTAADAVNCAGIIPPQTVTGNFLVISTDQGDVTYSLSSKAFDSGQSYTFNVVITASQIGTTVAITNWSDNGNATVEIVEGVEAVDLGLSVKWASMNIGASSKTDYGLYFAWNMTWGDSWCMPTMEEWDELRNTDNCTWEWEVNYNGSGVNGYLVTSKKPGYTSNSIFLPAAGDHTDAYKENNTNGRYWSSTLTEDDPTYAWALSFDSNSVSVVEQSDALCTGYPVRAVKRVANIGDYYYSDGTWSTVRDESKTVIGLVFCTTPTADDQARGYKHGYVIALKDYADADDTKWAEDVADVAGIMDDYSITQADQFGGADVNSTLTEPASIDLNGLTNTLRIAAKAAGKTYGSDATLKLSDITNTTYHAAYKAVNYTEGQPTLTAPAKSSGWYLPSIGQQYLWLWHFGNVKTVPDASGAERNSCFWFNPAASNAGTAMNAYFAARLSSGEYTLWDTSNSGKYYWSSTVSSSASGYTYFLYFHITGHLALNGFVLRKGMCRVRPVLAF